MVCKVVFIKQRPFPNSKDSVGFLEALSVLRNGLGRLPAPAPALLSASLGWIKSYRLPGLTCSVFQVCSGITAELLTGPCAPAPDSCIQLQKSQTGRTCFLAIVQGNCSPETPGPERNEILWCGWVSKPHGRLRSNLRGSERVWLLTFPTKQVC